MWQLSCPVAAQRHDLRPRRHRPDCGKSLPQPALDRANDESGEAPGEFVPHRVQPLADQAARLWHYVIKTSLLPPIDVDHQKAWRQGFAPKEFSRQGCAEPAMSAAPYESRTKCVSVNILHVPKRDWRPHRDYHRARGPGTPSQCQTGGNLRTGDFNRLAF